MISWPNQGFDSQFSTNQFKMLETTVIQFKTWQPFPVSKAISEIQRKVRRMNVQINLSVPIFQTYNKVHDCISETVRLTKQFNRLLSILKNRLLLLLFDGHNRRKTAKISYVSIFIVIQCNILISRSRVNMADEQMSDTNRYQTYIKINLCLFYKPRFILRTSFFRKLQA